MFVNLTQESLRIQLKEIIEFNRQSSVIEFAGKISDEFDMTLVASVLLLASKIKLLSINDI